MEGNRCLCYGNWPTTNRGWFFKRIQYAWRIQRVTSYINGLREHLFSSVLVCNSSFIQTYTTPLASPSTYIPFRPPSFLLSTFLPISLGYLSAQPRPICQFKSISHSSSQNCRQRSQYAISPLCRWLGRHPFFPSPNNGRSAHIRPNTSPIYTIPQSKWPICRLRPWSNKETGQGFRRCSDIGWLDTWPPYQHW